MATTTAIAMTMASMTTSAAASSSTMDMSSSTSGMDMTFFSSITTPLFSRSWQPTNTASYAASCIFLVAMAALLRVLIALRPFLDEARRQGPLNSGTSVHQLLPGRDAEEARVVMEQASKDGVLPPRPDLGRRANGRGLRIALQSAMRVRMVGRTCHALYEVLLAGIGYLLMLAVMTYNVGYFLSVLAGIFLGAFAMANAGGHAKTDQWETC
ncbi:hypothetical protein GQ53DRAFT_89692 [Thozetella sp. PMI_491]|nr:hypothetical protein GQ53DRAFT_89692 [Thozetella sp. PMI_491]